MNNRRYRIVYCAPALYSAGGVERVVSMKASYLADHLGYDVTVVVTEGGGREPFFPLSPQVKVVNLDLNFEELWGKPLLGKAWLYVQKQWRYRRLLRQVLMRLRPDFTISVLRREINFLNSIKDGSRKIGELHVNRANYRSFKTRGGGRLVELLSRLWMKSLVEKLRKLDCMVVLTETARADWPELTRVRVIPDPLPIRPERVSPLTAKRIVTIGRYDYDKGYDLLLRMWKEMQTLRPDWRLDIYGMGDRSDYMRLADTLGIDSSRCGLHGSIKDVMAAYLDSSVFVLPSRFEGFGLVMIEAMSCGLPVVAFDCDNGPRSILTEGRDGFLVPTGDVSRMAERLLLLTGDEALRREMGSQARRSSAKYELAKVATQWETLFDELKDVNNKHV